MVQAARRYALFIPVYQASIKPPVHVPTPLSFFLHCPYCVLFFFFFIAHALACLLFLLFFMCCTCYVFSVFFCCPTVDAPLPLFFVTLTTCIHLSHSPHAVCILRYPRPSTFPYPFSLFMHCAYNFSYRYPRPCTFPNPHVMYIRSLSLLTRPLSPRTHGILQSIPSQSRIIDDLKSCTIL